MKNFPSLKRAYYGLDTWGELGLRIIARITRNSKYLDIFNASHVQRLAKKYTQAEFIKVKDLKFPLLDDEHARMFFSGVFDDTFSSYVYFDDRYDEEIFNLCDSMLGEGLYGFVNDEINVQVEPDDIVIDAGSWIGDFAAYASLKVKKGGVKFLRSSLQNEISNILKKLQN